jgi:Type IV secretion-system coupling protein DNA-binding domain
MDNPDRVTYFAATDSRGKRTPFGLMAKDRSRHMYVIGKTGMGKSTLLENMAIQDIQNGEGLAFIDPHGGTADKLLNYIPQSRINDVVYFAPFDLDQPIAFNVMEDVGYDKRHLVVSGLMATFKKIWVDAWSARMEYILSNTLLALLEYPGATLLSVNRMYTDKGYRKKVVENVKDPVVKDFWLKEFANYGDRYTQEATPAIQNKIGQFTSNPLIRNIIGQPKSSFDIRDLMDRKKILIINLSKGQVGETNMRLLGSMLTTRIFLGAMSRADLHEAELNRLPPFYFYVDEFQNFANDTFAEILSEARKYHLNLIIAHQYVEQMEEQVRAAVFGNVGTTVAFRVGPFDAEVLETIFMPEFEKDDLVNLGLRQVYMTLMINGVGSRPFSAVTLPPIAPPARVSRDAVIQASRAQFGSVRANIESAIMTELTEEHDPGPATPKPRSNSYGNKPSSSSGSSTNAPRTSTAVASSGGNREGNAERSPAPRESSPQPRYVEERPRERTAPAPVLRQIPLPAGAQRAPARDAAPPKAKSADDLKSILRSMTATSEKKPASNESSRPSSGQASPPAEKSPLKDALADVLKKSAPAPTSEAPKKSEPAPAPKASSKPFEVPEDTLKALFKEQ